MQPKAKQSSRHSAKTKPLLVTRNSPRRSQIVIVRTQFDIVSNISDNIAFANCAAPISPRDGINRVLHFPRIGHFATRTSDDNNSCGCGCKPNNNDTSCSIFPLIFYSLLLLFVSKFSIAKWHYIDSQYDSHNRLCTMMIQRHWSKILKRTRDKTFFWHSLSSIRICLLVYSYCNLVLVLALGMSVCSTSRYY